MLKKIFNKNNNKGYISVEAILVAFLIMVIGAFVLSLFSDGINPNENTKPQGLTNVSITENVEDIGEEEYYELSDE